MLDDIINMEKGPLDVVDPDADAGEVTPTTHESKQDKVFPPCFPPPVSVLEHEDEGYTLCHECLTNADSSPFEWRDVKDRRVSYGEPAAASQASLLPTADDYANLFFTECSKEEEAGTGQLPLAASEPSSDDDTPHRTTAAATKRNKGKQRRVSAPSTTATSTKRRRVSFDTISTVHLLDDVPPCHAMTPEEKSVVWFSESDLEATKSSAQRSVREAQGRIVKFVKGSPDGGAVFKRRSAFRALMVAMEDETGSSVRGLENKVFRRKQKRQELIKDVLGCQSHVKGLEEFGMAMDGGVIARLLARASRERSLKSRRAAYADARDDHREIYGDNVPAGGNGIRIRAQRTLKCRKRRSAVISL